MTTNNNWLKWSEYILHELDRLDECDKSKGKKIEKLEAKIVEMDKKLAVLIVKLGFLFTGIGLAAGLAVKYIGKLIGI